MGRSKHQEVRVSHRPIEARRACTRGDTSHNTLLVLAAIALWVVLFVAFSGICGCSGSNRTIASRPDDAPGPWRCERAIVYADWPRSSLLFVPEPDLVPVPADQFTRADWPTTPSFYDYGQTTSYQEFWYDSQGLGRWDIDHGYRLFITQRAGQLAKP